MSRRRYISTEISFDDRVDRLARECGDFAVLLYTWAIPHALDDGSLPADPRELRARVIPYREDKTVANVEAAVAGMIELGLLERDGNRLLFPAAAFYRHQTYIKTWNRRQPRASASSTEQRRETPQTTASLSLSPSLSLSEKDERSVNGNGENTTTPQQARAQRRKTPENAASRSSELTSLVAQFHALPGVTESANAYGYIGKMAAKYGYDAVRRAIGDVGDKIGAAVEPLDYLAGVVKNSVGPGTAPLPDVDPRRRFLAAARKAPR